MTTTFAAQTFTPGMTISSAMGKWKQAINERPIARIECKVIRESGGNDTFINFRFGDDGQTIPGGKRYYLKSGGEILIDVPILGMAPGGKPLVINAYNGKVKLVSVTVHFQ